MSTAEFPKRICWLDIESTGTNIASDRIIDLAMQRTNQDLDVMTRLNLRFNPGVPIPDEATAIHGISNDDVAYAPLFSEVTLSYDQRISEILADRDPNAPLDPRLETAKKLCAWLDKLGLHRFGTFAHVVAKFMEQSAFGGYNLLAFDLPLLATEFRRAGLIGFPGPEDVHVIDAGNIFKKKEARTLSDAVRFYCRREHEGAHGAESDVSATIDVFAAQKGYYIDLMNKSLAELAEFSRFDGPQVVDWAQKLVRDAEGFTVYNIGKAKGVRVIEDPGFGRWMLTKDFPPDTLDAVQRALDNEKAMV